MSAFRKDGENARRSRWAFFILVFFCGTGCRKASPEEVSEFARISRAIDVLRQAENGRKAQYIGALREAPCHHFCQLRDECVVAYEKQIAALDLIERAKRKPQLVAADLDQAELLLKAAKDAATGCAAEQAHLRRERSL